MPYRRMACILLVSACLITSGCALFYGSEPETIEQRTPVLAVAATTGPITVTSRVAGRIEPAAEATIASKIPGRVNSVAVELGSHVNSGDIVVRINDEDIVNQVKQAESALDMARANLALAEQGARPHELEVLKQQVGQAQANYESARANYQRIAILHEKGGASDQQFDAAELQFTVAQSQYRMATEQLAAAESGTPEQNLRIVRAQVAQAEATVSAARTQLASANVRTPITGIVAMVNVKAGELVGAGTPLIHVVDIDRVIVTAGLTESLVNKVSKDDMLEVEISSAQVTVLARVSAVGPVADARTRSYPARLEIVNPEHRIKPGMFASVAVIQDHREQAILVPRQAIIDTDGNTSLFIINGDLARHRQVALGLTDGQLVEITHGVSPGELVITSGHQYLKDGQPITLVGR